MIYDEILTELKNLNQRVGRLEKIAEKVELSTARWYWVFCGVIAAEAILIYRLLNITKEPEGTPLVIALVVVTFLLTLLSNKIIYKK